MREIAHKRMLEEEIMRELEIERQFPMRRFEDGRFSPLPLEMEERAEFGLMQPSVVIREYERSPSLPMPRLRRDILVERDAGAFERPPVARKVVVGKTTLSKLLSKPEITGTSGDNKLLDHQPSGVKRKAAKELHRQAKREWTCSLCRVTATSQRALNVHLRGKRHKANEERFSKNEGTSKKSDASSSVGNDGDVLKGISTNEPTNNANLEGNNSQRKRSQIVWCKLCKVKCTSPAMLDFHIKGKKHKAQLRTKNGNGVGSDTSPTAEVVKEVTEQFAKREDVKADDKAEATDKKAKEGEVKAERSSAANDA